MAGGQQRQHGDAHGRKEARKHPAPEGQPDRRLQGPDSRAQHDQGEKHSADPDDRAQDVDGKEIGHVSHTLEYQGPIEQCEQWESA